MDSWEDDSRACPASDNPSPHRGTGCVRDPLPINTAHPGAVVPVSWASRLSGTEVPFGLVPSMTRYRCHAFGSSTGHPAALCCPALSGVSSGCSAFRWEQERASNALGSSTVAPVRLSVPRVLSIQLSKILESRSYTDALPAVKPCLRLIAAPLKGQGVGGSSRWVAGTDI